MQLHPATDPIPAAAKGAAIALGNFDGVHRGHQGVLGSARMSGAALGAAVFKPHPRRHFQPGAPPFAIQSPAQRARALAALGVAHLFDIGFDAETANLSDEAFARDVLAARLGVRHVSVGADFRFGRGRMGDVARLGELGRAHGFTVAAVAPITNGGERHSSTAIRAAIAAGDMGAAAAMLSRPWAIEGVVQKGFQRGRGIGVPTANLGLGDYVRPKLGVYAVRVEMGDRALRPGVASVGVNPTVGALPEPVLEAHVFDFDGDLYGRAIEVQLIAFLRPEAKFDGMETMKAQIGRDIAQARALLSD